MIAFFFWPAGTTRHPGRSRGIPIGARLINSEQSTPQTMPQMPIHFIGR